VGRRRERGRGEGRERVRGDGGGMGAAKGRGEESRSEARPPSLGMDEARDGISSRDLGGCGGQTSTGARGVWMP
jgi:hypothetical protein